MKIKYSNVNFTNDIKLPNNISEFNRYIFSTIQKSSFLNIISDTNLLNDTVNSVNQYSKNKKRFVVFGTGGSNLGARALINILNIKRDIQIDFFDNIDPIFFEKSFTDIDIKTTGFIIISKSGTTPETLSQIGTVIQISSSQNLLNEFYSNCLVITEFNSNPLYNIAIDNKCYLLEHKKDIGGRYSIFSNVATVPAILAGLDIQAIHNGAKEILNNLNTTDFLSLGQIFRYQSNTNYTSNVVMTYSDSLYFFGKWYLQLWAESIGKEKKGITPIHSIGTTDQHSQLQLYLDGPEDKFFTFITTDHSNKGLKINNNIMQKENLNYLINKKMGDLMQAEQKATLSTFKKNLFKFREIYIPQINEHSIGSLAALSIIETIAACIYFEVNPFNQPSVEQGKSLTKKYLS